MKYKYEVVYSKFDVSLCIERMQRLYTIQSIWIDHSRTQEGNMSFGILVGYLEK